MSEAPLSMQPSEAARRSASRAALAIAPGVLLAGVAGGIAFPILPEIGLRAGMPLFLIGAILAANRFGRIVSGPLIGAMADRFGGRSLLLVGLLTQVLVMGLYLLGVTTGYPAAFFLVGRLIHGPGSACVFVAATALALHAGGREHGGLAAGTVRAAMSIGLPLGVATGGVLSARLGPAWTFGASMVALVLAMASAFLAVPRLRARVESRVPWRTVVKALADRRVAAVGALNFAVTFSALGVVLTTMVVLVGARGLSFHGWQAKTTASALMGWMIVVMGLGTLAASRFVVRYRRHTLVSAVSTTILVPALCIIGVSTGVGGMFVGLTVLGLGAGALSSSLLSVLHRSVSLEHLGAGVGWVQLCGDIGGVLGPIIGASLLATSPLAAYLASAAILSIFVPVGWWLARQPEASSPGRAPQPDRV